MRSALRINKPCFPVRIADIIGLMHQPDIHTLNGPQIRRCAICGHTWAARANSPEPKRCPAAHCRSTKWRGTTEGQPIKLREPAVERELSYSPVED